MRKLYSLLASIGMICFTSGEIVSVTNDYFQHTGFFAVEESGVTRKAKEIVAEEKIISQKPCATDTVRDTILFDYPDIHTRDSLNDFILKVRNHKPYYHYICYDSIVKVGTSHYTDSSNKAIKFCIENINPHVSLKSRILVIQLPDTVKRNYFIQARPLKTF